MKLPKMIRLGLLENKYSMAALMILLIAFLIGLYTSYVVTHPTIDVVSRVETYVFNSTIKSTLHPPEFKPEDFSKVLNVTLRLKSTGRVQASFSYVEEPDLRNTVLLEPGVETVILVENLDVPPTFKCEFKPLEGGVWTSVDLEYEVVWETKSYMIYLSIPALFLAIAGATLGIMGYVKYVQKLLEEG